MLFPAQQKCLESVIEVANIPPHLLISPPLVLKVK
jgi:hypothetical protein